MSRDAALRRLLSLIDELDPFIPDGNKGLIDDVSFNS